MKQTAVQWLVNQLEKHYTFQDIKNTTAFVIAKEMEKEQIGYTEFEVLQLLLKLKQTESYDNLYDWFQENKKQTFNTNEK